MWIKLETNLKTFRITVEELCRATGKTAWPSTVDLRLFSLASVAAFVKYLSEPSTRVVFNPSTLPDIYDLAEAMGCDGLKRSLEKVLLCPLQSAERMCLSLSSLTDRPLPWEVEKVLTDRLARNFQSISSSIMFRRISPRIACDLLQRCDLPVKSELEVAMCALHWLKERHDALQHFYTVMCAVRVGRMSTAERAEFEEKVNTMTTSYVTNSYQLLPLLHILFNEVDSARCCVLSEHLRMGYTRCGQITHKARKTEIRTAIMFEEPRDIEFNDNELQLKKCDKQGECNLRMMSAYHCAHRKKPGERSTRKERRIEREKEDLERFGKDLARLKSESPEKVAKLVAMKRKGQDKKIPSLSKTQTDSNSCEDNGKMQERDESEETESDKGRKRGYKEKEGKKPRDYCKEMKMKHGYCKDCAKEVKGHGSKVKLHSTTINDQSTKIKAHRTSPSRRLVQASRDNSPRRSRGEGEPRGESWKNAGESLPRGSSGNKSPQKNSSPDKYNKLAQKFLENSEKSSRKTNQDKSNKTENKEMKKSRRSPKREPGHKDTNYSPYISEATRSSRAKSLKQDRGSIDNETLKKLEVEVKTTLGNSSINGQDQRSGAAGSTKTSSESTTSKEKTTSAEK